MTEVILSNSNGISAEEAMLNGAVNEIAASMDYNAVKCIMMCAGGVLISYRQALIDTIDSYDALDSEDIKVYNILKKFLKKFDKSYAKDYAYIMEKASKRRKAHSKAWSKVTYSGHGEPSFIPEDTWSCMFPQDCVDIYNRLYAFCEMKDREKGLKTLSEAVEDRWENNYGNR